MRVKLEDVCERGTSSLMQKDIVDKNGKYPVYGASGRIGSMETYQQEHQTVAVVKDGAGIGRTMLLPEKSSVIGTMQYLIPKNCIESEYLYYVVKYMHLEKYFSGATIPHIYFRDYKTEEFNLHDKTEQREIVSTLKRIEAIISNRQEQLTKLDELIKARFVEMFGDFEFNPKKFPIYFLCNLCDVGSSKRIYQEEQSTSGIPFLKISDLVDLIDAGTFSASTFIPSDRYERLCSQGLTPKTNDVLITSRGTLGKCYIVKKSDEFYFQDGMISWLSNISEKVSSTYISYLFMQPYIQKQILALQAGSTVAYLSISMLKRLNIILPPLSLQNQFSDFVAEVDKSKVEVQKALDQTQLLFDSLMQQYFG